MDTIRVYHPTTSPGKPVRDILLLCDTSLAVRDEWISIPRYVYQFLFYKIEKLKVIVKYPLNQSNVYTLSYTFALSTQLKW